MVLGGGSEFPDVDPRFDMQPGHLFGPFWSLQIVDTVTGQNLNPRGGSLLTGYGSVRRAARYSTRLWLDRIARRERREER